MRLLKQAMAVLGTALTIAVLVAIVAPKTAHAVAAALVQIVPGTTTHVGQNESQLVSLICNPNNEYCSPIKVDGSVDNSAYAVPSGYTLIVTDWEFLGHAATAGQEAEDVLELAGFVFFAHTYTTADSHGNFYFHEKYATGIRIGSGLTIFDFGAGSGFGTGYIQGYLVPNT